MSLIVELSPPLEAKLRKRAAQEGRDEAEIARHAVEQYLLSTEVPSTVPATGKQILAEWEADGVLGIWQDRQEDSIELARELRRLAESRGSGV